MDSPERRQTGKWKLALAMGFSIVGVTILAPQLIVRIQVGQRVKTLQGILDRMGASASGVHVRHSTHPTAFLDGTVSSHEVWAKLDKEVRAHFDDEVASRMLLNVTVGVVPGTTTTTSGGTIPR